MASASASTVVDSTGAAGGRAADDVGRDRLRRSSRHGGRSAAPALVCSRKARRASSTRSSCSPTADAAEATCDFTFLRRAGRAGDAHDHRGAGIARDALRGRLAALVNRSFATVDRRRTCRSSPSARCISATSPLWFGGHGSAGVPEPSTLVPRRRRDGIAVRHVHPARQSATPRRDVTVNVSARRRATSIERPKTSAGAQPPDDQHRETRRRSSPTRRSRRASSRTLSDRRRSARCTGARPAPAGAKRTTASASPATGREVGTGGRTRRRRRAAIRPTCSVAQYLDDRRPRTAPTFIREDGTRSRGRSRRAEPAPQHRLRQHPRARRLQLRRRRRIDQRRADQRRTRDLLERGRHRLGRRRQRHRHAGALTRST